MIDNSEVYGWITLSYKNGEGRRYEFAFKEPETWPEALDSFVSFMSVIYGYDISNKVAIKQNKYGFDNRWNGPLFDDEEDNNSAGLTD